MNLRKFSQQTYFKQQTPVKNENKIIEEEQDEVQTDKKINHKKNSSQFTSNNFDQQPKSQLYQKFKNFTQSTSPISKYKVKTKDLTKTVNPFTNETQQKKSKAEQEEMVDRLITWGKKKKHNIEKKQEEHQKEELKKRKSKPELSKETQKMCESGLRHHKQLNSFIKTKNQSTNIAEDFSTLTKLEKLQRGYKIMIEIDQDEDDDLNDENNKAIQVKQQQEIEQKEVDIQQIENKQYRSKSDYTTLPIHLRYEYELQYKEAKLKEMRDEKMKKFQQELDLCKKYNSTAEQFEHFLKEQEGFLKKKQQFYDQNLKKELEKIQETEGQFSFQPALNFPPYTNKNCNKIGKDEKFDERINTLREKQQKQKEFYSFKSTLPDLRQSIKKKYDEILHKNEKAGQNQHNENTEN